MQELISIIVPVYNGEQYLTECLESIIAQSYKNIEIIVVNDGSTDGTLNICYDFQKKDNRIIIVNQENKGVTASRKSGLERAKGKYIGFVDADDWIEQEMYEQLYFYAKSNRCQMVCSGMYRNYDDMELEEFDRFSEGVYDVDDYVLNNMIVFGEGNEYGIRYSNCNKLFDANIIKKIYSIMDDDVIFYEDIVATWVSIMNSKKITVIHKSFYHYRCNRNSSTHKRNDRYFLAVSKAFMLLKKELASITHSKELENKIDKKMLEAIINGLSGMYRFYQEDICCKHIIPLDLNIKAEQKIVLYGAGRVGRSYYKQLCGRVSSKDNIIWVDKDNTIVNESVHQPEVIYETEFDLVIIAVLREEFAKQIKDELLEKGVLGEKIWWKKPLNLVDVIYAGN